MNRISTLMAIAVFLLAGCATPLPPSQRAAIQRVAVVNGFPDRPNFTHVGTTVFNNSYESADESSFKRLVTETVMDSLRQRGFAPESVASLEGAGGYDLVIEIVPRDAYGVPHSFGYGFYRRTFLGAPMGQMSYVALNLVPILHGDRRCSACYGESQTPLPTEKMPDTWEQLDDAEKRLFTDALGRDIKKAVSIAFAKTKL